MITDIERREVTRKLRDCIKNKAEGEMLFLNGSSATIRWLISFGVFGDKKYHSGVDLINRLADLIEPSPSCEFWDAEEQECYIVHTARPVDRDALLALADEMDMDASCYAYVDDYNVNVYARRIREALGE